MVEKEYKFLVSKSEFDRAISYAEKAFNMLQSNIQINYYYDDDRLSLCKEDITLRVRQINEKLVLQRKDHIVRDNNFAESKEFEKPVWKLPKIIDDKYAFKGCLITNRCRFLVTGSSSIKLDFDVNFYLSVCDYEIEIEFDANEVRDNNAVRNDNKIHEIEELIKCLGIRDVSPAKGKALRFFDRFKIMMDIL